MCYMRKEKSGAVIYIIFFHSAEAKPYHGKVKMKPYAIPSLIKGADIIRKC